MITGEIKSQVDQLWNAFWSGGVSNPLSVIEQITYLLFIRRLDELHTLEEKKAQVSGTPIENPVFPDGNYIENAIDPDDPQKTITVPYANLRWSRLKDMHPDEAFKLMDGFVFQFLQAQAKDGSSHARHMRDARFGIPTAQLLARAMDMIDALPMERRDTKGDIKDEGGLSLFVRRIVGLDRGAARAVFAEFIRENEFNSNQIEFVDMIISALSKNGIIDPAQLYDPPFTYLNAGGLGDVFDDKESAEIISLIRNVKKQAVA